jgi:hypothetical protein
MTDDLTALQTRITRIVGEEDRLNRDRRTARGAQQAHRDDEKRTESANLATLEKEKEHQIGVNAEKEHKFQEALRRDGEELVNFSKGIRDDYIVEIHHREAAKEKLQEKITALESKLRSIEGART